MVFCSEIRNQIALYLDDELLDDERATFDAHVTDCESCRSALDRERAWIEAVRRARPLYESPPSLRSAVERALSDAPEPVAASPFLRKQVRRILARELPADRGALKRLVAAALLGVACLIGIAVYLRSEGPRLETLPSDFALTAVSTHLRHLNNQLPFEIVSDSPERISAWFAEKVSFSLKLPDYREFAEREKLAVEGARLVAFNNDYAAFIGYRMRNRPITLVVTSDAVAVPSGGTLIESKGLTFHFNSINGLKVITWKDRGLTYALVSDLGERGQQSCLICHEGEQGREFVKSLETSR